MSNYPPMTRYGTEQNHHRKQKKLDRLTRDALAAEAAGMSYGQYKALNPHTGEDEPHAPDPGRHELTCLNCGGRFIRRTAHKVKFCGDVCRNAYNDKKAREKRAEAAKE